MNLENIKAVFFDLDGTMLHMPSQDDFVNYYFKFLTKDLLPFGYEPKSAIKAIWAGTEAMIKNNGEKTNREVFWEVFSLNMGDVNPEVEAVCDRFYSTTFNEAKVTCGYNEYAKACADAVKARGMHCILSTNPIFPLVAQISRMSWTGLTPDDFEYVTTYENSSYCKPNPKYFQVLADMINVPYENCLVVGNDTRDDMLAAKMAGMNYILITDNVIEHEKYPFDGERMTFKEFTELMSL